MSLSQIRAILDRHGLHLSRDLGQNFLVDDRHAERLAQLAGVRAGDTVIEVGTGLGTLTQALAKRADRVITVEVDSGVVRALREEALLPDNVELIHGDALELDWDALVRGQSGSIRVVANLPYSAATPLLRRLLDLRRQLEDWSVMVQREMAVRLAAASGNRDYGSFSVLHQMVADVHSAMELSPGSFFPVPKVSSSFVRISPRTDRELSDAEFLDLERVARAAFGQRRKTLVNALLGGGAAAGRSREVLEEILGQIGIDPRARAETLDPPQFCELARALEVASADANS